jgi:DNA polymerase III epsilon subunit-like protein
MTKVYPGLMNLNGNLLAAVDFETTGRRPGYHEIIQIAIVPLDSEIRPLPMRPFYMNIKPKYPTRIERGAYHVHGLHIADLLLNAPEQERVQDLLIEWVDRLELPFGKVLVPLVQNWAFESSFLKAWLGVALRGGFERPGCLHGRGSTLQQSGSRFAVQQVECRQSECPRRAG